MKIRTSIGLLTVAIALTTLPTLSQNLPASVVAWADQIRTYGSDGRDGRDGRTGEAGRPGRPQTLRVDGQPQQVVTVGSDGSDGEEGGWGDRPICPAQPRNVRYHLQAPDGGNGGDGGDGGQGGTGGDVTLYYTEPAQLRQVLVDAAGGQAGRGGRGGSGAPGCRCSDRRWRVQVCNNGQCYDEYYDCRDGDNGYYGRDGRNGEPGALGTLWLVDQLEPLAADQPTTTQSLETLLRKPIALSKNVWEQRIGARALLASGSVIADTYNHYVDRLEAQAQVIWAAERSSTAFLGLSPTVTLEDSGKLQITFPDAYWIDGFTERTDNLTTYTLTQIVRAEDVTRLAWGNYSGQGSNFAVTVIDLAGESDFVNTQFELTYRTSDDDPRDTRRLRYRDRFSGPLPAESVTRDGERFVLTLGRLPISNRYFQSGTQAQIELQVRRSLGSNSTTQTLRWEGQL